MPAIPIYRGRGKAAVVVALTVVDDDDFARLNDLTWRLRDGYAVAYVTCAPRKTRMVSMHREILGLADDDPREGDHIDRDRLNNQRSNLRALTRAQNRQNKGSHRTTRFGPRTSRHRGVCWDKARRKWTAYASVDHRRHYLGNFDSEAEAARAASDFRARHMPYATNEQEA